ncbi:MAG: hypothetical protein DWH91_07315 [Planctomycetota bacterium]|nr:MAG: hypothetical protein DWH91_07315 [Planctomycetota bacterium]
MNLRCLFFVICGLVTSMSEAADPPPSAVGSVMKLLQSGKVPPARLGSVVEMVCTRGNEHDLAYVFGQVAGDVYPLALRKQVLGWLKEAATNRKVQPAGDLTPLATLLTASPSESAELQPGAIDLAAAWKLQAAAPALAALIKAPTTPRTTRAAALTAIGAIDPVQGRQLAEALVATGDQFATRSLGVTVLAKIDTPAAATAAAKILQTAQPGDSVEGIIDSLLAQTGGPAALGAALKANPPSGDVAKLCLRRVYATGRSDAALIDVLAPLAGVSAKPIQLTSTQVREMALAAEQKGDAARGEQVFRRSDLSCMKCHAVNKAGGQIGPDLTPVGANSPMDYLVTAIFDPDAQIKEAYITKTITTLEGRVLQGIAVDRTDTTVVLRNTDSQLIEIPISDIDEEIEGKSLMPKGLPTLMTEAEVLDLLKFLSVMGRPGAYEVRSTQRVQRWRQLATSDAALLGDLPNTVIFETDVLASPVWISAYSLVNGTLPLDEIAATRMSPVFYLQAEIDVVQGGPAQLQFDEITGLTVWVGKELLDNPQGATLDLEAGRQSITLRVDTRQRPASSLKLEFTKPDGSAAQFQVVDGP